MSFVNFNYYSFIYDEELSVEAEVDYQEPDYNNSDSDWDHRGGYDILSIDVYHENGDLVASSVYKQQSLSAGQIEQSSTGIACKLLDREVRDKLNQYLRCMEIEDSRYEASFGEINTDGIYYYDGDCT